MASAPPMPLLPMHNGHIKNGHAVGMDESTDNFLEHNCTYRNCAPRNQSTTYCSNCCGIKKMNRKINILIGIVVLMAASFVGYCIWDTQLRQHHNSPQTFCLPCDSLKKNYLNLHRPKIQYYENSDGSCCISEENTKEFGVFLKAVST